jgi:2-succinyl-5-enolpyruvyl-6-hydroxy-3-cyclohexene-1-carboxylate synthase
VNPSTEHARAVVATLVRGGLRHAVVCPGSRSAPLAYALYDAATDGALRLHVRHDERVAGFTALGIGKATGRPAAVVTTSGTAVANLHPAVLEAHHAGVPLLVLSADRPPRLRGTWANQTSDLQAGLFGAATRFAADLDLETDAAGWGSDAGSALAAALGEEAAGERPGPAVLNLGFDDPLVPDDPAPWAGAEPAGDGAEGSADGPGPAGESIGPIGELLARARSRRTVVVAGDGSGPVARRFAERAGLPLLAEPTSGARGGANLVAAYRLLLGEPVLGGQIEHVVAFGRPTLSRPVTRLLGRSDVSLDLVRHHPDSPRPERADVVLTDGAWVEALLAAPGHTDAEPGAGGREWLATWRRAGAVAGRAVDSVLDGWPVLTGPLVAREVAAATQPDEALVLAASNPVRDADLAAPRWDVPPLVLANRGVSGIDGTVSTAIGVALGLGSRSAARVLVGDVALLHDVGALVLGPSEEQPNLTVVVVNDEGGGIFSLLEPGADAERDDSAAVRFERVFGTPHAVQLAELCAGLGVPHLTAASAAGLRERLATAPRGLTVLEVAVSRADLRPLHDAIGAAVHAAIADVL